MNELVQDWYQELRRFHAAKVAMQIARKMADVGMDVQDFKRQVCPDAFEHTLRTAVPGPSAVGHVATHEV